MNEFLIHHPTILRLFLLIIGFITVFFTYRLVTHVDREERKRKEELDKWLRR